MGYIDVDMGTLQNGPGNRNSTHNSVGTKYEYLKHVLDHEIGCYIEERETSEGKFLVQKSRDNKEIAVIPWDGNVIPNPEGIPTEFLKKLGIGETIYGINGLPDLPSEYGEYVLFSTVAQGSPSITVWEHMDPISNNEIDDIWANHELFLEDTI